MKIFSPSPVEVHPYVFKDGIFDEDEIPKLIHECDQLDQQEGALGIPSKDAVVNEDIRISQVAWVSLDSWIADRLVYWARILNGQFYRYDIWGMAENVQYTTYYSNNKSHYNWHMDCGQLDDPPRKLSMVVLLSYPDEFKGGDLELMTSRDPIALEKVRGRVYMFPSYTLHRVTPVTKGVRKSLVVWMTGPQFR